MFSSRCKQDIKHKLIRASCVFEAVTETERDHNYRYSTVILGLMQVWSCGMWHSEGGFRLEWLRLMIDDAYYR